MAASDRPCSSSRSERLYQASAKVASARVAARKAASASTLRPQADLSNLRLHPTIHHAIEIEQPEGRTDKRGQFVLPVSPPEQNADALFEQAQAAEEAADLAEAERLYRVLIEMRSLRCGALLQSWEHATS
jgi:hypothetical protein